MGGLISYYEEGFILASILLTIRDLYGAVKRSVVCLWRGNGVSTISASFKRGKAFNESTTNSNVERGWE